jgi:hypothetical protein
MPEPILLSYGTFSNYSLFQAKTYGTDLDRQRITFTGDDDASPELVAAGRAGGDPAASPQVQRRGWLGEPLTCGLWSWRRDSNPELPRRRRLRPLGLHAPHQPDAHQPATTGSARAAARAWARRRVRSAWNALRRFWSRFSGRSTAAVSSCSAAHGSDASTQAT